MCDFPELPLIINEATRQKYSRYTVFESLAKCPRKSPPPKRQSRNPFECLNRNPHLTGKYSYANLKSLHLSRSRLDCPPSLDFSLLPTLPPLASVTAPRGSALKAYEEVLGFARDYLKGCSEQTMAQMSILRNLHGGVQTLNRRMQDIVRSGLVVLDPVLNIIFESLQAELALREERMADAGLHFRKAQFYSLKMGQYLFAGHCLIEQAEIYKSEGRLQRGLGSLKKALGVAILIGNQELQLAVLEKIGMLYYYNGNTAIGEQYHRYAERGLSARELQMFGNEFCLQGELRLLQEELFSLKPSPQKPQTKQFSRYDAQVNSDLQAESVQEHSMEITAMVAHMLKDNTEKAIGAKFRKHIRNTMSLARITPYPHSPPLCTSSISSKENLPFVNVAQVLKSHLSRNRGGTRLQRDWQVRTLLQMIDSLARCLG